MDEWRNRASKSIIRASFDSFDLDTASTNRASNMVNSRCAAAKVCWDATLDNRSSRCLPALAWKTLFPRHLCRNQWGSSPEN